MDQVIKWFLRARHKFVWDLGTIGPYVDVLTEVVYGMIRDHLSKGDEVKSPITPNIGLFAFGDGQSQQDEIAGYALYIAEVRLPPDKRHTLFADFKAAYEIRVGGGLAANLLTEDFLMSLCEDRFAKQRVQTFIERKNRLAKNFNSLANRSLNRRRIISARLRYQVLMRDNSTCQVCGRRAPDVRLHVDHIKPLSWDMSWQPSDAPDDYQVLCEECNLGKGSLSWLIRRV